MILPITDEMSANLMPKSESETEVQKHNMHLYVDSASNCQPC